MVYQIKIILLVIGVSMLSLLGASYSACAMDDDESQINLYSSQKININRKPSASAPKAVIEPTQSSQPETFVVTEEYYNPPQAVVLSETELSVDIVPSSASAGEEETKDAPEILIDAIAEPSIEIEWEAPPAELINNKDYILGPDDKIKVNVFGEKDISGEFRVTSDSTISLPLIGVIDVTRKNLRQAEQLITDKLKDGYLNEPIVSIEVIESRPFYIMGEVREPGSYAYVNGINILQAVALSGGYTYRANRKSIDVLRGGISEAEAKPMQPTDSVQPGDIIYVRERFF